MLTFATMSSRLAHWQMDKRRMQLPSFARPVTAPGPGPGGQQNIRNTTNRSSMWGTRCCWTRSTRPSRRARCSPRAGWAPSVSSRALRQTRAGSTYPRRGESSSSSTSNACARTSDDMTASAATRMPAHHRQRRARTAYPSTRRRSCSRSRCATAGRTYWCAGQAWTLRRGGRHVGAAHRQLDPLYRRRATADPADRLRGGGGVARRRGRSAGGQDCALLLARRWLAARHRPSPLPARRLLARGGLHTWRLVWPGPFDPGLPDPKFEFGRCFVTAFGPRPGGQRTFAQNVLLMPVSAAFSVVAEDSSFTPCGPAVYLWLESREEITNVSYRINSVLVAQGKIRTRVAVSRISSRRSYH